MALPYPRTSKQKFTVKHAKGKPDPEGNAEGFSMTIPVTGNSFKVGIQLPKVAVHGPNYIIFYTSFWEANGANSIVETGLSFSADVNKMLNFIAKTGNPKEDDHHRIAKNIQGQYFELDVTFKSSQIICKIANQLLVREYRNQKIGKVHLVIAAADHNGARFSDATMKLLEVDSSSNVKPGYVEWMGSEHVTEVNRRILLQAVFGNGMTCSLPRETLESGPADALGKWMPSAA